mgnify:CR=1 FL=1
MRILLVEDDKSIIMGLKYSLESEGYTVTAAESQADALEALERGPYELLLLDVMLPDAAAMRCVGRRRRRQICR